jgi:hypothetical protein
MLFLGQLPKLRQRQPELPGLRLLLWNVAVGIESILERRPESFGSSVAEIDLLVLEAEFRLGPHMRMGRWDGDFVILESSAKAQTKGSAIKLDTMKS